MKVCAGGLTSAPCSDVVARNTEGGVLLGCHFVKGIEPLLFVIWSGV